MRTPIRFSISKEFLPLDTFPHDARVFGSESFIEAARRYYESKFGSGSVEVLECSDGLDVIWTPQDAALNPFEYAIELLKKRQHLFAVPILMGLLKERPHDVDVLYNLGMAESDLGKFDERSAISRRFSRVTRATPMAGSHSGLPTRGRDGQMKPLKPCGRQ